MDRDLINEVSSNSSQPHLFSQKLNHLILSCFFALILLILFFTNIGSFTSQLASSINEEQIKQETLAELEHSFQEDITFRRTFINLYGLSLRALNTRVVGDFSFVKDDLGILQCPSNHIDADTFLSQMQQLKVYSDSTETALVYMAIPDKTKYLPMVEPGKYSFVGQISKGVVDEIEESGIDCLDFEKLIGATPEAPDYESFYFKTDGHCTTYGEFWMAKKLADHLKEAYHLNFYDLDQVFNLKNYAINRHQFVGNYSRSAGEFFTGTDVFDIYIPLFPTDFSSEGLSSKQKAFNRSGQFETVMMNNYDQLDENEKYIYWVTNYGQFRSPYYRYINNNAPDSAPRLLFVSDSVFMRGFSYLSCACKEITIIDPRFFQKRTIS